ncbi:urease accessory protein UreE [Halalkalibacter nanhaiisediminis]|uniref:Urease accessory protein UreE n=1 Tax=Halalkalibacter nanhaiisediminis TaxID=688079 RepID=A0A562QTX4_9BACI|nr:urease accessory protein UreE [Halalkalibacter nanhaiisediminis]TWI59690.1 urease accessory protein [Halalkalibacter nanhaiisediminis]
MHIKQVIGHLESFKHEVTMIEWVELDWEELNKRILRKKTDKGREIAIVLDEQGLTSGDILFHEPGCTIAIRTKLEPAYVIQPKSMHDMGKVAFELGNRHTPCILENNEIIVRYDKTLEVIFHETGVPYVQTEKRFNQPFKYKGHHHHDKDEPASAAHAHS